MKSKNIKKKIELLAPVGSFESLHAAIQAGADAIYFGVAQLNMRAKSINSFFLSDLPLIQATCSQHHIKTYITLNTVMYEHDMQLLKTILKEVKKHKIDAVIASDFAVMEYCRQLHIPLHVSTQANVSNIESIKFFASFSDAVVLARELTLKQVKQITAEIARKKINGISGKCYLSLHAQNSSANRGACSQNCRHAYKVTDIDTQEELVIENNYIMSPKDLCTIDILDQVIESGATILKIEGRGKGPEYVSIVTKIYKKALLAIEENSYTKEKIDLWKNELAKVYNRGFWEGYYLGRKLGEWTDNPGSAATEKKIYVGKGKKYFSKIKVGEFLIETGSIKVGDTLLLTGPGFGLIKQPVEKLLVNGAISSEAVKGDFVTLACEHKISPTDKLYKIIKT
jgi:putative protease